MTDTNLSAEGVFEVEVEERCGSLGADGGLDVELVSLQNVVNILGLPVDDCPANIWIYLAACCHMYRLGGVLPNDNAVTGWSWGQELRFFSLYAAARSQHTSTATHFLAPITHNTTRPGPRNLEQQTDPPPFSVLEIMCCVVPLHTLHFILFFKRCHKQGGE